MLGTLFLLTIVLANLAVTYIGIVPVGFGLVAPAAVYFVGVAFVLRDMVQERHGKNACYYLIVAGSLLSAFVNPAIAVASATAFFASELIDLNIYTRLRSRGVLKASFASNTVGAIVDSAIFLAIAFGSLQFFAGQVVGKVLIGFLSLVVWRGVVEVLSWNKRRKLAA